MQVPLLHHSPRRTIHPISPLSLPSFNHPYNPIVNIRLAVTQLDNTNQFLLSHQHHCIPTLTFLMQKQTKREPGKWKMENGDLQERQSQIPPNSSLQRNLHIKIQIQPQPQIALLVPATPRLQIRRIHNSDRDLDGVFGLGSRGTSCESLLVILVLRRIVILLHIQILVMILVMVVNRSIALAPTLLSKWKSGVLVGLVLQLLDLLLELLRAGVGELEG